VAVAKTASVGNVARQPGSVELAKLVPGAKSRMSADPPNPMALLPIWIVSPARA